MVKFSVYLNRRVFVMTVKGNKLGSGHKGGGSKSLTCLGLRYNFMKARCHEPYLSLPLRLGVRGIRLYGNSQ